MEKYTWALNPSKLQRAIEIAGLGASEENVKKAYEAIGGLTTEASKVKQAELVAKETSEPIEGENLREVTGVATNRPRRVTRSQAIEEPQPEVTEPVTEPEVSTDDIAI